MTTVSVSKLKVVWSAPDNAGPAIKDYDYQYRELKDPRSGDWTVVDDATSTATEVTIPDLAEDTEYEVQVRAESDEGTGAWSDSGDGETSANAAPAITSVAAVEVAENTTAVLTVTASDDDDDESYAAAERRLRFGIADLQGGAELRGRAGVESTDPVNARCNNEYRRHGRAAEASRAGAHAVTVTDGSTVTTVRQAEGGVERTDNAGPVRGLR